MKHKPAPVQGAATSAHVRTTIRPLVRSIALTVVLLAAPSVVLAQVPVSVVASDDTAGETPVDNAEFIVRLVDGIPVLPVTINYSVAGSASPGNDFARLSGSVTLGILQPEASITIEVSGNDGVFEGDETVTITLLEEEDGGDGDDDGGVIIVDGTASVTILDSPHSVTASTGANASENPASDGQITVSLGARNESGDALTVQYSVAGTATPAIDYVALSGVAVIPVGSSSASVDVTPLDDDLQEGLETVDITLTGTSDPRASIGTPATAGLSIADDDEDGDGGDDDDGNTEVRVSVIASDDTANETPADNGEFVVRRVGGHPVRPVTINYSVAGSASPGDDYAPLSGNVRLEAQEPEVSIAVNPSGDDDVFEGDESVTITLSEEEDDVVVETGTATVTILDSPHSVTASRTANASENPAAIGQVTASLGARNESAAALTVEYSVAGTATAGTDYEALNGVAVIPIGSSSVAIEITPIDDELREAEETVDITLTETSDPDAPVGSPATASVSIADDDSAGDDDGDGLSNSDECPDGDPCPDTDQDALTNDHDPDDDGDGIPTASENPPGQDTNDDGTPDYLENDDDGDGRLTRDEDANEDGDGNPATNPTDLDGDSVADYLDADDRGGPRGDADSDGLSNEREEELGTNPEAADTDGDGVSDGDEVTAATDPLDQRSFGDADGDLVPDAIESGDGTDPNDPHSFADGDGGGTADHIETITYASYGITPTNVADANDDRRDFDGDGLPDRLEISIGSVPDADDSPTLDGAGDDNGNGISNAVEAYLATLGIVAVDAVSDMDRDGYPDAAEVALGLNPLRASERDTDGDGVPDVVEVRAGIDIDGATDSDGDGVPDACEIALSSDPLDANLPVANGAMDDDGDGVSNAIEQVLQILGASGDIDASGDGDADGISDADEIRFGTDPFRDEQPALWIELSQADIGPVNALVTDGGVVTATAVVGGRQTGTLLYDWTDSSNAVLAVSIGGQTNRTLAISPQTLPPGMYNLALSVQRTVGDYSSPVSTVEFTVSVLAGAEAAQVADADNDGVPDASDDADGRSGFANELQVQSGARMQTETGVRLQLGTTARIAGTRSARVTREDIASAGDGNGGSVGNSEDDFDYASGIYDFEVTNLPEVGSTVQIVIPQAIAIGEFPEYRKFQPSPGWVNFVEDANNSIESAAGSSGACPEPGDDSYQPGLTPGHLCIQLTIEDGGPNDGDAALGPNGVIKDPGGVAHRGDRSLRARAAAAWALLLSSCSAWSFLLQYSEGGAPQTPLLCRASRERIRR